MILDLLAPNDWKSPVYYAITVSEEIITSTSTGISRREGLAYRIVPFASPGDMFGRGGS